MTLPDTTTLAELNIAPEELATTALRRCCGAERWVQDMLAARPFASTADLLARAETVADSLTDSDWLEAFSHHPKIGSMDSLRNKFSQAHTRGWSAAEQSGVQQADEEVLQALARGNEEYEQKYGYIFIVCATGKTAQAMLELLTSRLQNPPERELSVAAAEQRKITRIRLEKLLQ